MPVQTETSDPSHRDFVVHVILEPSPYEAKHYEAKPYFVQHLRQSYDSDMTSSALCLYFAIIVFFALFVIVILESTWDDDHTHSSYYHAHPY